MENLGHDTSSSGDALLVLGLPEQFLLGCDTMAVTIPGPQETASIFGLRDLPPGAHFVWVAPPDSISRQGFWIVSKPDAATVHARQWNRQNEVLGECASPFEARFLAADIESLRPKLLPYATAPDGIWMRLTSCISSALLDRVLGQAASWTVTTADTAKGEAELSRTADAARPIEFTFFFSHCEIDPYRLLTPGTDPVPDPTECIVSLLDDPTSGCQEEDLIGELQLVFLMGTLLSNLSCLEQWRHLVCMVFLRAHRLVTGRPRLCRSLLQNLHTQFLYLDRHVVDGLSLVLGSQQGGPGGLDIHSPGAARLQIALAAYVRVIDAALLKLGSLRTLDQATVGEASAQLETWLWEHGWQLHGNDATGTVEYGGDADEDEDQPVLVELDEHGREVGLVSWDD